jgi:hypothetical protein
MPAAIEVAHPPQAVLKQRTMGLRFRDDSVPSPADFTEAAQRLGLAAIRLTPAG